MIKIIYYYYHQMKVNKHKIINSDYIIYYIYKYNYLSINLNVLYNIYFLNIQIHISL
jgi:hypothetical protein